MEQNKKIIPQYKINGFLGMVVSMIVAFIGITYKNSTLLALLTPIGLLFGVFFIGYQMNGKIKDGMKWVLSIVILFSIIIVIAYLRK